MDSLALATSNYIQAYSGIEQRLQTGLYQPQKQNLIMLLDDDDGEEHVSPMHSTWGEWLAWWDAIDAMETRLDTHDVTRKAFVADDILYYAHYIPYRGHKDDLFDSADMSFSYEDYEEVEYFGSVEAENDENPAITYISVSPEMLEESEEEDESLKTADEPSTAEEAEETPETAEESPEIEEILSLLLLQAEEKR